MIRGERGGNALTPPFLAGKPDRFVRSAAAKKEPEPLAVISSCLHSDPRLNEEAAVALDQMVKAAYRSMAGQSPASSTSCSPIRPTARVGRPT